MLSMPTGKLTAWVQDLSAAQWGELPLLVPVPANLTVRKHTNASRQIGTISMGRYQHSVCLGIHSYWSHYHGSGWLPWLGNGDEGKFLPLLDI